MDIKTWYLKRASSISLVLFIGFLVALGTAAGAFAPPSGSPPTENAIAPLNTGEANQEKEGGLWLNSGDNSSGLGLIVEHGKVGIGIVDPQEQLHVAGNIRTDACVRGFEYEWGTQESSSGTRIVFFDDSRGWIVGGGNGVQRTTDGGETWQNVNIGANDSDRPTDVFFLNDQVGWIVGTDYPGLGATKPFAIKTTDGGLSWSRVNPNLATPFVRVHFFDENNGWVLSNNSNIGGTSVREGYLYRTTDGGQTWSLEHTLDGTRLIDMVFMDENTGWLGGYDGPPAVWRTRDGGDTWTRVSTTPAVLGLHFLDENVGWAAGWAGGSGRGSSGVYGVLWHTTDGGETWSQQTLSHDSGEFRSVFFSDASTGWVVGQSRVVGRQVLHTKNGGNTWTWESAPRSNLQGVAARSGIAFTVGDGSIQKRDNAQLKDLMGSDCADLAELYESEYQLLPGELVSSRGGERVGRARAESDAPILGVISETPALVFEGESTVMGNPSWARKGKVAVALSGRVPVRVTAENGPISPGDPISISSTVPGAGTKAIQSGRVAGIALESYDSHDPTALGTVLLFVNPHYWQAQEHMPNGIEIQDRATGLLYCVWIENGEWKKLQGTCAL